MEFLLIIYQFVVLYLVLRNNLRQYTFAKKILIIFIVFIVTFIAFITISYSTVASWIRDNEVKELLFDLFQIFCFPFVTGYIIKFLFFPGTKSL